MDLDSADIIQEEIKYAGTKSAPVFQDISADDVDQTPMETESLCMRCQKKGKTRLMLIRVPFFKELIVGSFECKECGFADSEINSAGRIQEKGLRIALQVSATADLNRQIVKSDSAVVKIPHLEFEIPPKKGGFTTIEGIIDTACEELLIDQPQRRLIDPETAARLDEFIVKLKMLLLVHEPFQFLIEDPTGNSHIENPKAPSADPLLHTVYYTRTQAQDEELGISSAEKTANGSAEVHLSETPLAGEPDVGPINISDEVIQFPSNCTVCNHPCETNMKMVDIPRFKQVLIMAMVCDACGYRDNEVKSGTGIAEKGHKLTVLVRDSVDLSRDLLKSDTASCTIPELDIHLVHGSLGGKFTTVEGLISNIRDQLKDTNFTFTGGDSSGASHHNKIASLCEELNDITTAKRLGVHLIIDDPAGNSYIQDIYEPEADPCLTVEDYVRNEEQNEELGLCGMNTSSTDSPSLHPTNT